MGDLVGWYLTCALKKREQERGDPLGPRVIHMSWARRLGAEVVLKRGADDQAKEEDERWNSSFKCGEKCYNDCPPCPFK